MALLESTSSGRKASTSSIGSANGKGKGKGKGRSTSPFVMPRSPVRSMLDVHHPPGQPVPVSMTGESSYLGSPVRATPSRSMLDISSPVPNLTTKSAQTSPIEANHKAYLANSLQHRSLSDASSHPAAFGPRATAGATSESNYQLSGYTPGNPGGLAAPKRNSQTGSWAKKLVPSAMAEVVRGGDLSTFGSRERGRNNSVGSTGLSTGKSRSPHNRWSLRSSSPKNEPSKYLLKDGRTLDMNNAYRRLSDANLAQPSLSSLSGKGRRRTNSGDATIGLRGARLEKDYTNGEGAVADSSDDDSRSSEDDSNRGRKKTGRDESDKAVKGPGKAKGRRSPKSQMAAAEEEGE